MSSTRHPARIDQTTVVTTSETLAAADLGDEAVVLDPASGQYYALNDVARRIVELATGSAPFGTIVDHMMAEYDVDRARLTRDIESFVTDLAERGLVRLS